MDLWIIIDDATADALVAATEGAGAQIRPGTVIAGDHAGMRCVPASVYQDIELAEYRGQLSGRITAWLESDQVEAMADPA